LDVYQITFKTLGHFKATMEYHRTKDILHVMSLLGHKNIRNTLVYTHLVKFENDEWICRVAKQGTEYVVCVSWCGRPNLNRHE
jgi:site-specific recombinase XerC